VKGSTVVGERVSALGVRGGFLPAGEGFGSQGKGRFVLRKSRGSEDEKFFMGKRGELCALGSCESSASSCDEKKLEVQGAPERALIPDGGRDAQSERGGGGILLTSPRDQMKWGK